MDDTEETQYPKEAPANVIVFYVNIDGMSQHEITPFMEMLKKTLGIKWEGTETIFLPVTGQQTRIEVMHLNPPHERDWG